MIKKNILASSFLIVSNFFISNNCFSISLNEALSSAYENDTEFKTYQMNFLKDAEQYPMTLSEEFLPNIEASYNKRKSESKDKVSNQRSNQEIKSKSIDISQNLFSSGRSLLSMKSAKSAVYGSIYEYYKNEQDHLKKLIEIYISTIETKEKLETAKAQVGFTLKEFESQKERLRLGEGTKTEVALTEAYYLTALYVQAAAQAEFDTAHYAFKSKFFLDPIDLKFPEIPDDLPQTIEEYKEKTFLKNPVLLRIDHILKSKKDALSANKASLLPTVNLNASLSEGDQEAMFGGITKKKNLTTVLSIRIPILPKGGAAHSSIRQRNRDYLGTFNSFEATKRDMETQIIRNWEFFKSNKIKLEATTQATAARQLAYEGSQARYNVGNIDIVEVLKNQKEYFDEKMKMIDAKKTYILSAYEIKKDISELTASNFNFDKAFNPEKEFSKIKFKLIGF